MPTIKANGINIYYEIHGRGAPLVLISGYGSNSKSWSSMIPYLSQIYRVIVFDNRGTGRSDKPDYPYTMKMMADDVAGLLDVINIKTAHVWGLSMGGAIAQELAICYSDNVISLILACTSCGGVHSLSGDPAMMTQLFDMKNSESGTMEEMTRKLMPILYTKEFIENNHDIIEAQIRRRLEYPTPAHGYEHQAQAVQGHDTFDRLPQINAPTLVIAGSADKISPIENARILVSRIPNVELFIMKNMQHGLVFEAAEKTSGVVLNFLKKHQGTKQS